MNSEQDSGFKIFGNSLSAQTSLVVQDIVDSERQLDCCMRPEPAPIATIFGLRLLFDEDLLSEERVYFNAGRLDRSLIVSSEDLVRIEKPIMI